MDKNFSKDLSAQFKSCVTLTPQNEYQEIEIINYSPDKDCMSGISDDPGATIIPDYLQCDYSEIKNIEDDWDREMEDLLLGIKDSEGNFLPNDDVYDLTEEQENYLLSDDSHYIQSVGSCNRTEYHAVDGDEKLFFIDVTPSSINVNDIYVHQVGSFHIGGNSNSYSS